MVGLKGSTCLFISATFITNKVKTTSTQYQFERERTNNKHMCVMFGWPQCMMQSVVL